MARMFQDFPVIGAVKLHLLNNDEATTDVPHSISDNEIPVAKKMGKPSVNFARTVRSQVTSLIGGDAENTLLPPFDGSAEGLIRTGNTRDEQVVTDAQDEERFHQEPAQYLRQVTEIVCLLKLLEWRRRVDAHATFFSDAGRSARALSGLPATLAHQRDRTRLDSRRWFTQGMSQNTEIHRRASCRKERLQVAPKESHRPSQMEREFFAHRAFERRERCNFYSSSSFTKWKGEEAFAQTRG